MQNNSLEKFDLMKANLTKEVAAVVFVELNSKEDEETALETVRKFKLAEKKIEELRVATVKPLNDHVDEINKYSKELKQILNPVLTAGNNVLVAWNNKQRELAAKEAERIRIQKEEERKAAQKILDDAKAAAEFEASLGETEQAKETILVAANQVETAVGRIDRQENRDIKVLGSMKVKGVRTNWKIRSVDAKKVPKKFLKPDESAILAAIKEADGKIEIPGVEFYSEDKVSIRT